jgi:hypothetical protein
MKSSRIAQAVLAASAVMVALGIAAGCGAPSSGVYCDKMCDCTGCTESERADCTNGVNGVRKTAGEKGCSGEFDQYLACIHAETTCVDDRVEADGCDAETSRLTQCAGAIGLGASCTSLCEESQKCQGSTGTDCAASCAKADALNKAAGCAAQYDTVVVCDNKAGVCNQNNECGPEIQDYIDCVVQFCSNNPGAVECNG